MNLEMIRLEIIGLKSDLQSTIHTLRQLGCVQIDKVAESPDVTARPFSLDRETVHYQERLSFLVARLEGLIETLGIEIDSAHGKLVAYSLEEIHGEVEVLRPEVQSLTTRRERLLSEQISLPRYESTLRRLLPIIPPAAHLAGNVTVGVLVSRSHVGVLDAVTKDILDITEGRAEVVASDVDRLTRAMLIVFPRDFTDQVEGLLGREDVSRLRLPAELGEGPPDVVLATLHRRMASIPEEIQDLERQLKTLAAGWRERLCIWRDLLREELDANQILSDFGETDLTFVLIGWVPARNFSQVKSTLEHKIGNTILVNQLPITPDLKARAPVILDNPRPARPFESLVRLLALPRYGHIDPTRLMAFFLPLFFGMILGDVGYGALLLALSIGLRRRFSGGVLQDVLTVLAMGSAWAIVFGFLYGEAFGTLGELVGMHPLWFDRSSAEHVFALLSMTLALGSVHITLGLLLGLWEAFQARNPNHLLERGGMLLGLVATFFIVAVLSDYLPETFMTPAICTLIIGVALLGASLGWLGLLMGPIEFIGLIGNVLSYLRIAAIGLASVYLAKAANDVAGAMGNVIVGVMVGVLIHGLNLVLGAFSPTIHSLRLHYVEFFRKFYEGGGRTFNPYRSQRISETGRDYPSLFTTT